VKHLRNESALTHLIESHSIWSQATFGSDLDRGPIGPLKHLQLEAQEAIDAPAGTLQAIELADCFLLLIDASRRAGIGFDELVKLATEKHWVNIGRSWPKPTKDEPVKHQR